MELTPCPRLKVLGIPAGEPGMPLRGQNSYRAPQGSEWEWGLEVTGAKNCP